MSLRFFTSDYGNYKGNQIKSLSSVATDLLRQPLLSGLKFKALNGELKSQLFLLLRNTKGNNGLDISRQRHGIGIHEATAFQTMLHRRHFDVGPAFNLIARHNAAVVVQKEQRKKDYFHGPGPIDSMR